MKQKAIYLSFEGQIPILGGIIYTYSFFTTTYTQNCLLSGHSL